MKKFLANYFFSIQQANCSCIRKYACSLKMLLFMINKTFKTLNGSILLPKNAKRSYCISKIVARHSNKAIFSYIIKYYKEQSKNYLQSNIFLDYYQKREDVPFLSKIVKQSYLAQRTPFLFYSIFFFF